MEEEQETNTCKFFGYLSVPALAETRHIRSGCVFYFNNERIEWLRKKSKGSSFYASSAPTPTHLELAPSFPVVQTCPTNERNCKYNTLSNVSKGFI